MKLPRIQVKWTMCVLGALTGLAFAVWLASSGEHAEVYFGRTFDEFQMNLFGGRLHLGRFLVGFLAGALIGWWTGALSGESAPARGLNAPVLAAGAYLWVCLWAVVGVAVGGWLGRTSTTDSEWGIDAFVRYYEGRQWGAFVGAFVGCGLFLALSRVPSSRADLTAENERLRGLRPPL